LTFRKKNRSTCIPAVPTFRVDQEEHSLLEEELADVRPLNVKKTAPRKNGPRAIPLQSGNQDAKLLEDFISGKTYFDWSLHPGYQQGGPQEHNSRLIHRLKKGEYTIQAHLDLHGLTQIEALEAMESFLIDAINKQLSCVRIVHGKGNNSTGQQGVLKQKVPQWLQMKRLSRYIVAFTSASPKDGGIGATYVLLRKRRTFKKKGKS